jgi:hypothetical protein
MKRLSPKTAIVAVAFLTKPVYADRPLEIVAKRLRPKAKK